MLPSEAPENDARALCPGRPRVQEQISQRVGGVIWLPPQGGAARAAATFRTASTVPALIGRPREYAPERLLPVLKAIWLAALQPCGKRLVAALPEWVPAYEADHRRLDGDVRQALLGASAATLDRLLKPLRVEHRRRGATRPGTLLRREIPIRTDWAEHQAGYLEMDTVALCGGVLDDRHSWMFDAVDIQTTWIELRAMANRGQMATLEQVRCGRKSALRAGRLGQR